MNPAADALNHLLRQNSWACERLRPYAGKTIRLDLFPFSSKLTLVESGEFVPAVDEAEADAGIMIKPVAALRFLASHEVAHSDIALDGDTEFGEAVGKVLRQLEWEYEEDLSRLIGDIPAHELVKLGKRAANEGRRQLHALAATFADYWLEEQPLIAKQRHIEQFSRDVDQLRDDVERLAKRIEKLEKHL